MIINNKFLKKKETTPVIKKKQRTWLTEVD